MTPKQERFVAEYLIDLNATQAAIRAGYSENTAYSIGQENLNKPDIAAALKAAIDKRNSKLAIDAEWVLRNAVALHERCIAESDRTNERQTLELIGKHVDIAAFKERTEHSGTVGHIDLSEDIEAVERLLGNLASRSTDRPSLQ